MTSLAMSFVTRYPSKIVSFCMSNKSQHLQSLLRCLLEWLEYIQLMLPKCFDKTGFDLQTELNSHYLYLYPASKLVQLCFNVISLMNKRFILHGHQFIYKIGQGSDLIFVYLLRKLFFHINRKS